MATSDSSILYPHFSLLTVLYGLLLVFIYVFLSSLYQIVYYRFFHPLSKFPGPFWASVTRLWVAYHCYRADEHTKLLELHKKYGTCYFSKARAGTNEPLTGG